MAKFVCLFVIVAIIEACSALNCYNCGQRNGVMCKGGSDDPLVPCVPTGTFDAYCGKFVIGGRTEKRCTYDVRGKKLECFKNADGETCICQSDKCNSSSTISISSFAFLGLAAAFFVQKIFLH